MHLLITSTFHLYIYIYIARRQLNEQHRAEANFEDIRNLIATELRKVLNERCIRRAYLCNNIYVYMVWRVCQLIGMFVFVMSGSDTKPRNRRDSYIEVNESQGPKQS